jgi:hypothetical protein
MHTALASHDSGGFGTPVVALCSLYQEPVSRSYSAGDRLCKRLLLVKLDIQSQCQILFHLQKSICNLPYAVSLTYHLFPRRQAQKAVQGCEPPLSMPRFSTYNQARTDVNANRGKSSAPTPTPL